MTTKPIKRVAFADMGPSGVKSVLKWVEDRYQFEISRDRNADYVFHSVIGYDVLKYDGIRIFLTGENVTPNFAISDYAMSFERTEYGDRNFWYPLIKYYSGYEALRRPRTPIDQIIKSKSEFCSYVVSNMTDTADARWQILDLVSHYKKVNSGGRFRNNVGGPVADKLAFQKKHKFAIAFENSSSPGYITEKFSGAAEADAIPIYWGAPDIGTIFNTKAFVNCHDYPSLSEVVERVKQIDQDDGLYRAMLAEPWFPGGIEPPELQDESIRQFLTHIFDQDIDDAYRRNRSRWSLKSEQRLYDMYHRPHVHSMVLLRRLWRRVFVPEK